MIVGYERGPGDQIDVVIGDSVCGGLVRTTVAGAHELTVRGFAKSFPSLDDAKRWINVNAEAIYLYPTSALQ